MSGVPADFAEHKLHVRSDAKSARETKKIPLDAEHPERYAVMGTNLDSK